MESGSLRDSAFLSLAHVLTLSDLHCQELLGKILFYFDLLKCIFNNRLIIAHSRSVNSQHVYHVVLRNKHLFGILYTELELWIFLKLTTALWILFVIVEKRGQIVLTGASSCVLVQLR